MCSLFPQGTERRTFLCSPVPKWDIFVTPLCLSCFPCCSFTFLWLIWSHLIKTVAWFRFSVIYGANRLTSFSLVRDQCFSQGFLAPLFAPPKSFGWFGLNRSLFRWGCAFSCFSSSYLNYFYSLVSFWLLFGFMATSWSGSVWWLLNTLFNGGPLFINGKSQSILALLISWSSSSLFPTLFWLLVNLFSNLWTGGQANKQTNKPWPWSIDRNKHEQTDEMLISQTAERFACSDHNLFIPRFQRDRHQKAVRWSVGGILYVMCW